MQERIISLIADEAFTHHGDLTVQNIESGATVKIIDGSLTVMGNIADRANITLTVSQELKTRLARSTRSIDEGTLTIKNSGGRVSYTRKLNGVTITSPSPSMPNISSVTCGMRMNNCMVRSVNINGRILTEEGAVEDLGKGKYRIFPYCPKTSQMKFIGSRMTFLPGPGLVNATVDGNEYVGKEILVDGRVVTVDGIVESPFDPSESLSSTEKPPVMPTLLIHGTVGDMVVMAIDCNIEFRSNIGIFCDIKSTEGSIEALNIGESTKLSARDSLTLLDGGTECELRCSHGAIKFNALGATCVVEARDAVKGEAEVQQGVTITSKTSDVTLKNVGEGVTITARDEIKVKDVGAHSRLISNTSSVTARELFDDVRACYCTRCN